jgi:hypothetical protein
MMAFGSTSIAQTKFHNDEIPQGKMKGPLTTWITLVTLLCALAIPVLRTALAKPAPAEHPEYRAAINDLRNARKHLEKALNDGYGHRDRAMRAIDHAIGECEPAAQVLH